MGRWGQGEGRWEPSKGSVPLSKSARSVAIGGGCGGGSDLWEHRSNQCALAANRMTNPSGELSDRVGRTLRISTASVVDPLSVVTAPIHCANTVGRNLQCESACSVVS